MDLQAHLSFSDSKNQLSTASDQIKLQDSISRYTVDSNTSQQMSAKLYQNS